MMSISIPALLPHQKKKNITRKMSKDKMELMMINVHATTHPGGVTPPSHERLSQDARIENKKQLEL